MQQAQGVLEKYRVFDPSLKRRDLEQMFVDRINAESSKKVDIRFVSWKMKQSRLDTKNDLVAFYQMCDSSKSFAKYWWWSQKAQ